MDEILQWRTSFYEKWFDLRVLVPAGLGKEEVGALAASELDAFLRARKEHYDLGGRYISTRQSKESSAKRVRFWFVAQIYRWRTSDSMAAIEILWRCCFTRLSRGWRALCSIDASAVSAAANHAPRGVSSFKWVLC